MESIEIPPELTDIPKCESPTIFCKLPGLDKLVVCGDVGAWLGFQMSGGEILVRGHGGEQVGERMSGGVLRLGGDYKELSPFIRGGDIYHKGVQIVKDGTRV